MKKLMPLFLLLLLLAGCCPCRHMSTTSSDSTRVEVRESVVYKIDTVLVDVPHEVERIVTLDTFSRLENSLAISLARISGGLLEHSLENKPVKLEAPVVSTIEYRDSIVYRDREVVKVVEQKAKKKYSGFVVFQIVGFWLLLAIFLLCLVWRIFRRKC